MKMYPKPVQEWITGRGGLPPPGKMIYLKGKELTKLFKPCPQAITAMLQQLEFLPH